MTSEDIRVAIRNWLAFRNWRAKFEPERGYFDIGIKLDCTLAKVRLILDPQYEGCLVYVIPQLDCPSARVPEASRYLTLANFGLVDGNFEIWMQSGEVRYKCFINGVGLTDLPIALIDRVVKDACSTFRRYADGLSRVIMMSADANEEIRKIEPRQALSDR